MWQQASPTRLEQSRASTLHPREAATSSRTALSPLVPRADIAGSCIERAVDGGTGRGVLSPTVRVNFALRWAGGLWEQTPGPTDGTAPTLNTQLNTSHCGTEHSTEHCTLGLDTEH